MVNDLKIGECVYHKDLYYYREPFKVVGLTEDTVTLEGDFSSMYGIVQRCTLPIEGGGYLEFTIMVINWNVGIWLLRLCLYIMI